jgi:hypothetical protein
MQTAKDLFSYRKYWAKRFGTATSAPLWDPIVDFDSSWKLDMKDIAIVARNFGMHDA